MASPRFDGSPEQAALDVHRLESDCGDYESVVMVKLTDEIVAALMQAQRKGLQIRVHIEEQGGKWELGDPANGGRVFRYQQQALPGPPTDAVVHDPRTGTHRAVAAFRSKYQIQATDKSFADTRERAQKLIEEEKSRGTKDVTKHRQKGSLLKTGTPRLGSASSSQNVSPLLRTLDSSSSRSSPNKFANSTGTNGNASLQNGGSSGTARATPTQHLNSELRKKKLRQRIIQLVVLGKFSGADLVLRQLRKDGLNEEAGIERRVEDIVREVSEPSGSGSTKITLKPSLYGEVDTRWLWYNQEEKAYVRRVTQGLSSSQTKSTTFAPMRKSGMERMQAPGHSSSNSSSSGQTVSPEAIPTPPNSRPASAVSAPIRKTPPPKNTNTTVLNGSREQTPSINRSPPHQPEVPSANKRKAHVPVSNQQRPNDGKRPRQESASPPEDPTNHPQHNQKLAARSGGSTASSRLSSPCSLSSPTQPSCDWDKSYGEIKNVQEAEKYFALFQHEYPEYLECYRTLNEVAKEFRQLEMQLKNAVENRRDTTKVEQTIQMRFAHFDKDPEFIKTRQRYADLHSKLAVLKSRISDFERAQDAAAGASTTAVPMDLCDLE
uniref:OCEL domain-containing protein n=1 Tax=Haemonchus contortus TaxID=6289 RepID=A0A7I4YHM5_HAECO